MSDQCLRAAYGHRLKPWVEVSEKFKLAAVATGAAVQAITLTSTGTTRHIRSVTVTVGDNGNEWGPDGYFQVHRHTTTPTDFIPPSDTFLKETYFNNSSIILFESSNDSTLLLYLYLDHNAGSAKDVHVTVEYYAKA